MSSMINENQSYGDREQRVLEDASFVTGGARFDSSNRLVLKQDQLDQVYIDNCGGEYVPLAGQGWQLLCDARDRLAEALKPVRNSASDRGDNGLSRRRNIDDVQGEITQILERYREDA